MPYVAPPRCSLHTSILRAAALRAALADAPAAAQAAGSRGARPPTVADAAAFMARAESVLNDLGVKAARADWVANTYITFDSEELTAQAQEANGVATRDLATQAGRYERLRLPPDLRRKLLLLKLSLPAPPPPDAREAALRVRPRDRPAVGPAQAALPPAARLRARSARGEIRPGRGPAEGHDPGASARQPVGAGLGEHLRPPRAVRRAAERRPYRTARGAPRGRARHGALRRAVLHVARLRFVAGDVLGALDDHEAARPRRRVSRERLGHRWERRPPGEDVHAGDGRGLRDDPSRAGAQLLPARLQEPALPVPRRGERRLPRGDRGRDRAVGDARVPPADRAPGQLAERRERHGDAVAHRARQDRVSAVRARGGRLALGRVRGRDHARSLQRLVVGPEAPLPGRRRAGGALGAGLRPCGEIPRCGERAVHPLLHRADPAVPVSPVLVSGGGLDGAAVPVLRVRQCCGGAAARPHARRGAEQAVAGHPRRRDWGAPDGRDGDGGLLPAARGLARAAEPDEAGGVVRRRGGAPERTR